MAPPDSIGEASQTGTKDPCTFSNLEAVRFSHLSLSLEVDFEASVLRGVAKWRVTLAQPAATVVLDTRGLAVTAVTVQGAEAAFSMGSEHAAFGTPMAVELPEVARQPGSTLELSIAYATTPASSALGWLPPAQTAGKLHPYVFSQVRLPGPWAPGPPDPKHLVGGSRI
jgi:aminopeptidase N